MNLLRKRSALNSTSRRRALSPLGLMAALTVLALLTGSDAQAARRRAGAPAARGPGPNADLAMPANPSPLDFNNRAVAEGRRHLWEAAVHDHETALNGDPYNGTFRMNLSGAYLRYGQDLMAKGQLQQAIQKFHMALYVDPNNIAALECCSTCWKALKKNPDDPAVRKELGEKYETEGNFPEAIAEYRQFVRIVDSGPSHAALGRALVKQGQIVPARAVEGYSELKIALSKDWPKDQQLELARCHLQLAELLKELVGKAKERGDIQAALKRLANSAIEYRRAATLFGSQNLEGARGLVEVSLQAVALNPKSFDNHLMLAGAYQLVGDFDRAKKEYESCYALSPNNPKLAQARRSYHLAVVSAASGAVSPMLVAGSVQKVEDMLRQNPSDAELLYIYGRGKDALGDHDTAMQAYREAAKYNPYINADLPRRLGMAVPGMTAAPGGATAVGAVAPAAGSLSGPAPVFSSSGIPVAGAQAPGAPKAPPLAPLVNPNAAALSQIQSKFSGGDSDGAQKELMALIDKAPTEGPAWFLLGQVNEKKGDLEEATVAYRQATYLNIADATAALKRVEKARTEPLLAEGDKAIMNKDWVNALNSLKQAENLSPNDPGIHRKIAEVLKGMGDTKEADRELSRASDLEKRATK